MATDPVISIYVADKEVTDLLKRLYKHTRDLRPQMRVIGEYLLLETDKRIEDEKDVKGKAFEPLSQYTLSLKRSKGRILKILQDTGRLRDSINYEARRDSVSIGSPLEYAKKPQLGIGQPIRQYLGISKENEDEIIAILEGELTKDFS